jgi:hypothetical protein
MKNKLLILLCLLMPSLCFGESIHCQLHCDYANRVFQVTVVSSLFEDMTFEFKKNRSSVQFSEVQINDESLEMLETLFPKRFDEEFKFRKQKTVSPLKLWQLIRRLAIINDYEFTHQDFKDDESMRVLDWSFSIFKPDK